jgi:DNA-directed RNA polymerase subunit RPC12/RpoP
MQQMNPSNRPRASFRFTLYGLYLAALLCFFAASHFQKQLDQKGYIHLGHGYDGYINVDGNSAVNNIKAYWFGAFGLAATSIILNIRYLYLIKRNTLPEDQPKVPEFVTCLNCFKSFREKDTQSMHCPDCGGQLEDTHGIYQKHPELLLTCNICGNTFNRENVQGNICPDCKGTGGRF